MNTITENITMSVAEYQNILQTLNSLHSKIDSLSNDMKSLQNTSPKQLNRKEVADYLGLTWQQVEAVSYRKDLGEVIDKNKNLPCEKIGRHILYDRKSVEDFKLKIFENIK